MDRIAVLLKTEGPSGLIAACGSDYSFLSCGLCPYKTVEQHEIGAP